MNLAVVLRLQEFRLHLHALGAICLLADREQRTQTTTTDIPINTASAKSKAIFYFDTRPTDGGDGVPSDRSSTQSDGHAGKDCDETENNT